VPYRVEPDWCCTACWCHTFGGEPLMWWGVMAAGAAFALVPNVLDPTIGVNGSVMLGVGLLLLAGYKLGTK